ncbi:MAG: crosslink repair DNA glycosylase YcaQ family protein, partial [Microbacterium sp.]|uniref:DNA glycosylase AlkZ-like family protein n=1 Tax=Microbacterium sp. TaxID=51671 RepID=UPI0039E35CB4
LRGGGRLTRAEAADRIAAAGVATDGQRGIHLLLALSVRGVICQGPVVPRESGISREQFFVLSEEWLPEAPAPADPAAELFVRFIDGHGPATAGDFAWWSGLTLTACRAAAEAASDRVRVVADEPDPQYVARRAPRSSPAAPAVVALPAFDEYYLSYLDRQRVCALPHQLLVGPGANGMISPLILAGGVVAGRWTHSRALGRREAARADMFGTPRVPAADVDAALDRYAAFIAG